MTSRFSLIAVLILGLVSAPAEEQVYSGPQIGEKTTPFKVVVIKGPAEGEEADVISENQGAPTALVFINGIERSLVPLLLVIDQYGAGRKDQLKTEVIFLMPDRLAGEQRVKAAAKSLQLQSRIGLSLDGAEGPGNFGLNKECQMTIVAARGNVVTANFALVQPGIVDAPKVLEALAIVCGDSNPPTVEALMQSRTPRRGGQAGRDGMKRGEQPMAEDRGHQPVDFSKFDVNSEDGLRDAVNALMAEVASLREELAELRGASAKPGESKAEFPGAVPTDEKLSGFLRRFIRPTNDDATVDKVLAEVKEYIQSNPNLRQQAIDGWTRVLHFGDRYGTPHSRKLGAEFLENLKAR